jgi:hypothetical protein
VTHPGQPHSFHALCRLCGEPGYLHLSIIGDDEYVDVKHRPALDAPTPPDAPEPDGVACDWDEHGRCRCKAPTPPDALREAAKEHGLCSCEGGPRPIGGGKDYHYIGCDYDPILRAALEASDGA